MEETISTLAKARLFHTHTNQHLKVLSKYIYFWTFVSFIWQKKEQMEVMNLQTIWRNCGRGTLTQTHVAQNTVLCDVISSQANNTAMSVPYRRPRRSEISQRCSGHIVQVELHI